MTAMTAYDAILDALRDHGSTVRANGVKASAQCPGHDDHDDHDPSLSLRRIEGQALLHCHAGCSTDDVLASLDMTMADLYDDNGDDWKHPAGWKPRPAPSPIGDPEHFCDRILQQDRLEADPAWRARRAAELADAVAHRPGDFMGRGHA